mmetsp:Transcript_47767/g.57834  ORF Transcript_47767/g.57834 Transcript_47767/m.57834 type:complete len:206 (-) Transcript_47767:797-1414(-)
MGLITSLGLMSSVPVTFLLLAELAFFGLLLNSCSLAFIISSFSFRNFSLRRSSAFPPKKGAASKTNILCNSVDSAAAAARASSSSLRVNGLASMRLNMPSSISTGRSPPSTLIPRLFRMKLSSVIFFSCLMLGLCKSVFNIITLKPKINAVSADENTSSFCLVNRSANFSMIRSIFCASPGKRNPLKNDRMASSKTNPVKSITST